MILQRLRDRVTELQAQLVQIQTRADRDKLDVQRQIDALSAAIPLLTPQVETAFETLLALKLIPKE
jgi:hypothetical protein